MRSTPRSTSSSGGGGGEKWEWPKEFERRERIVALVAGKMEECLRLGEEVDICESKGGENDPRCQQLASLQQHCYSELLCPRQSETALACLRREGALDKCIREVTALRECVEPAFDRLASEFEADSIIGRTERECTPTAELVDQCKVRHRGDFSKCQGEIQELNRCVGGVACPRELESYRACLKKAEGAGASVEAAESQCGSERMAFANCVVDGKLAFYTQLGIPLKEFAGTE